MNTPITPNQIRLVGNGNGLMLVVDVHPDAVAMLGHGCRSPRWYTLDRIGAHATVRDVEMEQVKARARKVDCNSPGCWCRSVILSTYCAQEGIVK